MQLFVKLSGKTYVIDCLYGDLIDKIIVNAFQRYLKDNNSSIKKALRFNYPNFIMMSSFHNGNSSYRFRSKERISRDMNEITLTHTYLGGSNVLFNFNDITYINNLLSNSKL
tara:strand:- start:2146 stop:2481 length:336 start_codon:yes stop_codon:yes gene_type:complete